MPNVTIVRSGNGIKIVPPCTSVLVPILSYRKRIQKGGDARSAMWKPVKLYRLEADGLLAPAGLTERVVTRLQKEGHTVTIEDRRPAILPEPRYENLEPLRPGQDEILAKIISSDHGVICAPTGSGKSWCIRQICKLWPDARIIICSPFSNLTRQTAKELQFMFGPNEVGIVGIGQCNPDARIVCAMAQSLMRCRLDKCQIFIFDEVHRAGAPTTLHALGFVSNARRFGFSASPHGRSDNTDLEVEGAFGPVIVQVGYEDAQKAGAVVPVMVEVASCAGFQSWDFATTNAMERNLIWRHTDRNKLIANLAMDAVKRFTENGEEPQILISVSKVEHAVQIGRFLPDFTLVYASMNAADRLRWERDKLIPTGVHPITPRRRAEIDQLFKEGKIRKVIATGVWSTGMDFPNLKILIRADGQASEITSTQIPGRVTRIAEGKEMGLVIDLDDSFNPTLQRRALKRFAVYRKKGWIVTTMKPVGAGT